MKQIESRQKEGWKPVCVLSIAGSDSGGGAGLQADLKTVSSLGGFSATAVSAVTVQNTQGVKAVVPVPVETVCAQVEAVCEDLHPDAIK
ncbi:MAG: hydroxymethylpyrimidine/phosphomethylpyrimidine kinase, partial [Bacteroidales bacterium]|nr:hydroxymethylpyrimidine/phosphomethylpyrimidine kinase [Bacteroidales bacterium]